MRPTAPSTKRQKFTTPPAPLPPSPPSAPSFPSTRSNASIHDPGSDTEEEDNTELENHYLNRMTDAADELSVQTVFGSNDEVDVWKSIGGTTYVDVKPEVKEKMRREELAKAKVREKRKVEDMTTGEGGSFEGSSMALGGMVKSRRVREKERVEMEKDRAVQAARPKKILRPRRAFPDLQPLHTLIDQPVPQNSTPGVDLQDPVLAPTDQDTTLFTTTPPPPPPTSATSPLPMTSSFYWKKPRPTSFNKSFDSDSDSNKPDALSSF